MILGRYLGIFAEKIGFAIFFQLENPWYLFIEKQAKDGTEKKYKRKFALF